MLTHVIPQECVPALQRLYERGVLEPVDVALNQTSFAYNLTLLRNSEAKYQSVNVVPRIHLNYLRDFLYNGLEKAFKPNLCEIMRDLYSSGLGIMRCDRLAAYWRSYAVYSQPVHNGHVISQSDLLAVFKAHIESAEKASLDQRYAYQVDVMKHFKRFSRFSFTSPFVSAYESARDLGVKKVTAIEVPKTGHYGHLVYKRSGDKHVLYSAFTKLGEITMPFIRQSLDSPIPNEIVFEGCNSTFVTLVGKFNFVSTVSELTPGPTKPLDLWKEFVEYDLVSHSDFKPEKTELERKLAASIRKNADKFKKARKYIRENPKGTKTEKAKAFVSEYKKRKQKLESITVSSGAWEALNPAKHLMFMVIDCFASDSVNKKQKMPYEYNDRLDHLKSVGFKVPKTSTVSLKKTTTLLELVSSKKFTPYVKVRTNEHPLDIHDDWFK